VAVKQEQPGRWRRLAPSPKPVGVVERDMIRHLVAAGHIVVACGGGGPPVYDDPALRLEGIDAVVDKDRVAAILGRDIEADVLLLLTNVDAVYHGYGTPHQRAVRRLDLASADHLLAGSEPVTAHRRPKVAAAAPFRRAGRTDPRHVDQGTRGAAGARRPRRRDQRRKLRRYDRGPCLAAPRADGERRRRRRHRRGGDPDPGKDSPPRG